MHHRIIVIRREENVAPEKREKIRYNFTETKKNDDDDDDDIECFLLFVFSFFKSGR